MASSDRFDERVGAVGAILVVRARSIADPAGLTEACVRSGLPVVEITLTTRDACSAIAAAAGVPGSLVGAGTVRRPEDAVAACTAGASFLVGPTFSRPVAAVAADAGVPYLPGALTPTEIAACLDAGFRAVKIFPARVFGPTYLRDVAPLFAELRAVPSGGVSVENARAFLDAGAWAVCAGGSVVPPAAIEAGTHEVIRERVSALAGALGRTERSE